MKSQSLKGSKNCRGATQLFIFRRVLLYLRPSTEAQKQVEGPNPKHESAPCQTSVSARILSCTGGRGLPPPARPPPGLCLHQGRLMARWEPWTLEYQWPSCDTLTWRTPTESLTSRFTGMGSVVFGCMTNSAIGCYSNP